MNETLFKVKRVAGAWSGLMVYGLTLPFCPNRRRLRKLLDTREILHSRLPTVRLESLVGTAVPDIEAVTLKAVSCHQHNCTIFELTALAALVRSLRPKRILEIGTFDGRSALAMAANLPADSDAQVVTLNLPPDYLDGKTAALIDEQLSGKVESGYRWRGHPEASRIRQVFGNSLEYDFAQWKPTDLAFIDGGHEESIAHSDSLNVMQIIDQTNGTILWHDGTRYGVKLALEKLRAQGHKIYLIAGTTIAILRYSSGREVDLAY
jgi:hypothetical protein